MSAETWEPGIPLYSHGSYTNYVFNFRDDICGDEPNGDAASWPEPRDHHKLNVERDELAEFIEAHRMWRANQDGAA